MAKYMIVQLKPLFDQNTQCCFCGCTTQYLIYDSTSTTWKYVFNIPKGRICYCQDCWDKYMDRLSIKPMEYKDQLSLIVEKTTGWSRK